MKFQSLVAGTITGVQFFKGSLDTGTHTAELWSSSGQLLATATFTNETASGWQQILFSTPVAIAANTTYIVSYHHDLVVHRLHRRRTFQQRHQRAADGVGKWRLRKQQSLFQRRAFGLPHDVQQGRASSYWVDVLFVPT